MNLYRELEMRNFCVVQERERRRLAIFWFFRLELYDDNANLTWVRFRNIGVLNRCRKLRISLIKYKFSFDEISSSALPSSLLWLPINWRLHMIEYCRFSESFALITVSFRGKSRIAKLNYSMKINISVMLNKAYVRDWRFKNTSLIKSVQFSVLYTTYSMYKNALWDKVDNIATNGTLHQGRKGWKLEISLHAESLVCG